MRTRTTAPTAPARRTERRDLHVSVRRAVARSGEQRTRAAGGPQDQALYRCGGCGHAFDGAVSTHVACPRCGTDQAW